MSSYRTWENHVSRTSPDKRFSLQAHGITPKVPRKIPSRLRKHNAFITDLFRKCLSTIYPSFWHRCSQVQYYHQRCHCLCAIKLIKISSITKRFLLLLIFRFLELPPVSKSLETLIDHMGVLYKFHDRPISYLYNTLHYYELRVRDRAMLKKKLISNIVGRYKALTGIVYC